MRLYSRGQVVFFSVLSCLLTAIILIGTGKLAGKRASPPNKTVQETTLYEVPAEGVARVLPAEAPQYDSGAIEVQSSASYTEDERENISVYERLNSAVVNVTTETMAINWFLEPVPQEGGSGSGSIIDARGYVLTNNHVIRNAYKVYINLADGSQYEGTVAGTDPENDLAVVKFDPPAGTALKTVPYGDSGGLKVGQKVLAIGNPFALERTLTVGIVSGLGRPVQITRQYIVQDMIQTDASINPGNSGGPLLDSRGRMIGINTMIYSPSGGSVGIGFAVPVNTAKRVVNELIQYGKVRRGWFDATMVQLFPELVRYAKLPVSSGLLVSRTRRGGAAEKAGLKQGGGEPVQYRRSTIYLGGDIITSVEGMKIATLSDLYSALEHSKPGDKVKVGIQRGGEVLTLEIPLADREEVMNN
jgi:S1-C subfamily serine protease